MEHGESLSKESTQKSRLKEILLAIFILSTAITISLIIAMLLLMYLSYGNEMWPILFNLKNVLFI